MPPPPYRLSVLRDRSYATFCYRGLVIGLLGALALLLATSALRPTAVAAPPRAAIIDVSRHAAGDRVVSILGLGVGERVIAIDDVAAATEQVVDVWRRTGPGQYLDLTVADGGGAERRVLVLVHR